MTLIIVVLIILCLFEALVIFKGKQMFKDYQYLKKNYSAITLLQDIMSTLAEKISTAEKLEKINKIIIENFDITYSSIVIYNGKAHVLKVSNTDKEFHPLIQELASDETFVDNIKDDLPKYLTVTGNKILSYNSSVERSIKSVLFLPLYIDSIYNGFWLLEDIRENAFDKIEKVQLSILKENLALIIENSNFQMIIENMVMTDPLTGLYNRFYLYSKVRGIIKNYGVSTLVILDIDGFKNLNNLHGRKIGDQVLLDTVKAVAASITSHDIFIRYGGGEFIILLAGVPPEQAKSKIMQIKDKISQTSYEIESGETLTSTVCLGITKYDPYTDIDQAIKSASEALLRAQSKGKNQIDIE